MTNFLPLGKRASFPASGLLVRCPRRGAGYGCAIRARGLGGWFADLGSGCRGLVWGFFDAGLRLGVGIWVLDLGLWVRVWIFGFGFGAVWV